jgi:hypothetical protein
MTYSVHHLNNTVEELPMKINIGRTKVKVFRGKELIRSKICINNRILEKVNTITYFECNTIL